MREHRPEFRDRFLNALRQSLSSEKAKQVLEQVWVNLNTPAPLDEALLQWVGGRLAGEFVRQVDHEWDEACLLRSVHPSVTNFILNAMWEQRPPEFLSDDNNPFWNAPGIQLDADLDHNEHFYWHRDLLAPIDVRRVHFCACMAQLGLHTTELDGIMDVMRQCGGWDPFRGAVVLVERPSWIFLDEGRRLHSHVGMALRYPDGWGIYAWHGVPVPEQVILRPETLTPQQILNERNAEVRRVMIERLGLDRFLAKVTQKSVLDVDQDGQRCLYRLRLSNDEPIVAVKVRCPSTGQVYFLRVPPHIRTCRAAVAWTFGFEKVAEYRPVLET